MKRIMTILLVVICVISITGCKQNDPGNGASTNNEIPYTGAPKIQIDGKNYYAVSLDIINELPNGYEEAGELTEDQLKYAYIQGNKYYVHSESNTLTDFYVYQECGTPMEEGGVDNAKRQWAYVHWTIRE